LATWSLFACHLNGTRAAHTLTCLVHASTIFLK
jgi:hypothetical protein